MQPQPPATQAQPPPAAPPPNDGQAIAALVLSIAGLFVCPIIPSIIAIVLGRSAERRIKESNGTLGGEGLARAGWIIGIVGVVTGTLFVLLFLGIFVFSFATIGFISKLVPSPTPAGDFAPVPGELLWWL
jgi:hypothetical protein